MSKISVIMPCYNCEAFVGPAIESVLGQDYPDFELIFIDDGSTDGSSAVAEKYADDERFKAIWKSNGGVSSARNLGLDACTGDYVTFIDADDQQLPGNLRRKVELLDGNPEVVGVFGRFQMHDSADSERQPVDNMFPAPDVDVDGFMEFLLRYGMYYGLHSVAYRMSVVNGLRFDTELKLGEDFKFILEMASRGPHLSHDEYCALIRRGHNSITRRRARFTYSSERRLVTDFYREHPLRNMSLRDALSWQHVRFSKRYQGNLFFKTWKHALLALVLNPMNVYAYKHLIGQLVLQRSTYAVKQAE
ncbi:glycosyl transferase family 2 [Pseudodesulfovibrio mercurii]|uniref:Glycosyl transferase family 2 n=1 Tax=Pseudodesulfovibrio mercurii TaxID=641491 RepID=F0JCA2_9BACT|nr:glycosyltransferase family 2 protein [Pseudodesulfovibrio mercurii]EGB14400.1 glycosyl transferase family 2 [Pseudodesulfovibrio mercurii]